MSFEEIVEKARNLIDVPIRKLTDEEYFLAVTAILLDEAKKGTETLNYREWFSFRDFRYYVKKYVQELNKLFGKYGYIRFGKYVWKKLDPTKLKDLEIRKRELMECLDIDEDAVYVLECAYKLFKETRPGLRDYVGFNRVHTFALFNKLKKERLTLDDINWINKILLKYEDQLRELGMDFKRLEERYKRIESALKYPFSIFF